VSDFPIAYLAGFFDGEGCVHVSMPDAKNRMHLTVQVSNTNYDPLVGYMVLWGGRIVNGGQGGNGGKKDVYSWRLHANDAQRVLKDLAPYLIVKKRAAELGIRFQDLMQGDNSMKKLNHPRREEIYSERKKIAEQMRGINGYERRK
jgi:hypothetical protein